MPLAQAELSTLFTTAQERQLINANRYKTEKVKAVAPVSEEKVVEARQPEQKEVKRSYKISGITLSADGINTVWINNTVYDDGTMLEDKSKIRIITGSDVKIRITAPDGKHHYATSGETLEVKYMANADD